MKKSILVILLVGITNASFATFQGGDILKYKGEELRTPVFPLEDYKPIVEKKLRLEIEPNTWCSANIRGYVATWQVESNKLYLVEIQGWIAESFDSHKKATLELLFPDKVKEGRVLADWFTGTIFTPGLRWGASLPKEDQKKQETKAKLIITVEKGNVTKIEDTRTPKTIDGD